MAPSLTAAQFNQRDNLPDWRVLLGRIEAMFLAGSFEQAAGFAKQVAKAAESAKHHPDINVRYPDVVHVVLTTHSSGGLTEADASLAATISEIASSAGFASKPLGTQLVEIGIDALDIDAVRPFWQAVLGYVGEPPDTEGGQVDTLVDPLRIGPGVWFQQMDAPRPQRNRIHLDITAPNDVAEARVKAALAAGGTLVSDKRARAFWVLADPEGNEACVCTWQDRG